MGPAVMSQHCSDEALKPWRGSFETVFPDVSYPGHYIHYMRRGCFMGLVRSHLEGNGDVGLGMVSCFAENQGGSKEDTNIRPAPLSANAPQQTGA